MRLFLGNKKSEDKRNEYIRDNPTEAELETIELDADKLRLWTGKKGYGIPNVKLTPAEIFAGNVAALDANFFETNTDYSNKLGGDERSIVLQLKSTITKWYVALRNIAIVGLLSVLLYIGIRIIISSNAGDKAKYKQFFVDWVVALCLIFFLHYIMSFTMTMAETITDVLSGDTTTEGTIKQVNIVISDETSFSTNFTGAARMQAQYTNVMDQLGFSIIYVALTVYTVYFSFIYIKRLLMLAFFTIVAPLVALTYPLDKIKDGKAQAFNYWFKEYMFYAILQPLHMLLYTVFVSSTLSIASTNLIYAIVALAFIVPAEKIIKQMFGIKGQTESNIAGFAGGALASQAFNALKKNASGGGNKNAQANAANNKIRQAKNPNSPDSIGTLAGDAAGLDAEALAAGTGAAIGAGAGAAAFQNSNDPVAAAEKEALEEKIADGQIDTKDLTAEQKALLGMNEPNNNRSEPNNNESEQNNRENEASQRLPQTNNTNEFNSYRKRLANNFKRAAKQRYVAAGGAKGIALSAAKSVAKGAGVAAGTITMGSIGLAAGIVGGDMSDTLKGMGAGLAAGAVVSKKAENMIGNTFSNKSAVGRFANDVLYGDEVGRKQQFIKQYKQNPETAARILEDHPDYTIKQVRAQQEAEAKMMYDTGSDDYSTVSRAVKLEKELAKENKEKNANRGPNEQIPDNSHDMAVSLAKLSKNYDNSTFTDDNKYMQAQIALKKRIEREMNNQPGANRVSSEYISKQANAEAAKTLERIRKIKKL